jgi:hypothetical protein
MTTAETSLLGALREGDETAFAEIVEHRHRPETSPRSSSRCA